MSENYERIIEFVRACGAAGKTWRESVLEDEVQEWAIRCDRDTYREIAEELRSAHDEGFAQYLLGSGWVARWTTASQDYDSFGTRTLEQGDEWSGKRLRRVIIDPAHLGFQETRYGSGLHGCWEQDPRIEEAERMERIRRLEAERQARESARESGLVWLAQCSDEELESAMGAETDHALYDRGLTWQDARQEKIRRREENAAQAREDEFVRVRALIPDGCVLVDDGIVGLRSEQVHYGIRVLEIGRNAETSLVYSGGNNIGTLFEIASAIEYGSYRVVDPKDAPPENVWKRFGSLRGVMSVEIETRRVWVGRTTYQFGPMVLDENGRLVRARALRDAALAAYQARREGM